ncbi:membrane protein insertion efficiency factor YidD [bacterium]|nr:MAG: membrane protein insertion efficiency factor YidD [bacterium]
MASRLAIAFIDLYRKLLSPLLPPSCRFYPSCSAYAREAFEIHGFFRGAGLTFMRVCRCHPFHPGGFDPVPSRRPSLKAGRSQEI